MIASWKQLIYTMDQIRQLRNKPHIEKIPDLYFRLKRAESEVDQCVDQKMAEWAAKEQPELTLGEAHGT